MPKPPLRSNKPAFFGAVGAAAGLASALLNSTFYQLFSPYFFVKDMRAPTDTERMIASYLQDLLIFGLFGAVCTAALIWANYRYQRKAAPGARSLLAAAAIGTLGALTSTAIVKTVFVRVVHVMAPGLFTQYLLRSLCWAAIGTVVGLALARVIRNLRNSRAALGGFIGGLLGGGATTFLLLRGTLGACLSFALTGAALGLSIAVIEKLFREAGVEVFWAPRESTSFNLGPAPLVIGGASHDHIVIPGLPAKYASLHFESGRIEYLEHTTGTRTALRHGSRLQFGSIEILIHAAG